MIERWYVSKEAYAGFSQGYPLYLQGSHIIFLQAAAKALLGHCTQRKV